jgi:hypothetical protein
LIQTSAAPRKTQVNEAIFHLLLVLTSAFLRAVRPSSRVICQLLALTLVGVPLFSAKEAHSFVIIDVLRAIDDGNHFLLGTNGLTGTGVLGNFFEVALRRIPIAPDLNPNFVVGHNSSFAEKTCPLAAPSSQKLPDSRPPAAPRDSLIDLLPLIPYLPEKLFAGGDLCRSFNPLGRAPVNHAHHAASRFGFYNDQQIYGIRVAQDENEYMSRAQSLSVANGGVPQFVIVPSARVRHGPEDSLNASPNLACGAVFTTASYMSSAVLMKCVWPTMMLVSSGNLIRTDSSSIMASFQRAGDLRISF